MEMGTSSLSKAWNALWDNGTVNLRVLEDDYYGLPKKE